MAAWILVLCISILVWSGLKYLYALWWKPKVIEWKLGKQGIHGLPYKLLNRNSKEMMNMAKDLPSSTSTKLSHDIVPQIDPFLQKQATLYKKFFVMWNGTTPRVTIMDPKMIRDILSKAFEFHKPEVHWSMKYFLTGLANIDGDEWVKHRKIINPAFHMEKLKRMLPAFMTSCEEMVEKWDHKLMGQNGTCELDAFAGFLDLTGDVISRAAFGRNLEEGRMIFTLQREQGKLFLQSLFGSNLPWSRFLPTRLNRRMKQIHKEVGALLGLMIDEREKAIQSQNTNNDDLLTVLLSSNRNEIQGNGNQSKIGMTREDIIEECKLFYFAGHETTANLLTWTMIALSMHQDWQQKAKEEVLTTFGRNRPTFDQLNRLKIVNTILLEVLRLYPPTSLVRWTYKETKVADILLPAGVIVQIPLYMVHRDTELWGEDAMEFNPERFADGISKACKDHQVSFFSFGWGPRICIGQNFAMIEAKLALSLILQRFSFELSSNYRHAPSIHLTLQPKFGAQIILRKA